MILDRHPRLRYRRILPNVLTLTEEPAAEEPRKKRKLTIVACDTCREKKIAVSRKSVSRPLDDATVIFGFITKYDS